MRPIFQPRLINGPFGDPCLRVDLVGEHRTLLFDLGMADPPGPGRVFTVSDAFVSHLHIDHFIGFDPLLRALLTREAPLRVFGPEGITEAVRGKLRGYAWNLAEEYPLAVEVVEILPGRMSATRFECRRKWAETPLWTKGFSGVVLEEPVFRIEAAVLDHKIPCLAYTMEEPFHININKRAIEAKGLRKGQWLKRFKDRIRAGSPPRTRIRIEYEEGVVGPKTASLGRLMTELVIITKGQKIGYLVDAGYSDRNRKEIVRLMAGANILYSEAPFLHKDVERATASAHLTARQAGALAREARVRQLQVFHFSPRYEDQPDLLIEEAQQAFHEPPAHPVDGKDTVA
jgi:ribonuclease Z